MQINEIVELMRKFAEESKTDPRNLTLSLLAKIGISERQIRKCGGLSKIKDTYFPDEELDLKEIARVTRDNTYVNKIKKIAGEKLLKTEELLSAIEKNIKPLPKINPPKIKDVNKNEAIESVAMLNDTHIGSIIDPEEIGNLNQFNMEIACKRFAFYVKQVINYKKHKRKNVTRLHLILNGDLIAGLIHGLDTKGIHLMIHQVNAAVHIFTHAIASLSKEYKEVVVHGIPGNHDRAVHKNHGKRAVTETYDSYANIVFYALSVAFRNSGHIKFEIPKTPYGFIDLPAGRAMYAHGDHIFSSALGNPGKSINVDRLTKAIRDFNAGEILKGNPQIKLLLLGHVHVYAHFMTTDGVEVYISPSLSGTDGFAHSLTINTTLSAQPVFESTKDMMLGDCRLIRLHMADNDKNGELLKIIPSYKNELKWRK